MKEAKRFIVTLICLFACVSFIGAQTETDVQTAAEAETETYTVTLDFSTKASVYGLTRSGDSNNEDGPATFKVNDITIEVSDYRLLNGASYNYLRLGYSNGALKFSCPTNVTIESITFTSCNTYDIYLKYNQTKLTTSSKKGNNKSIKWTRPTSAKSPYVFNSYEKSCIAKIQITYTRPKVNVTLNEKDDNISSVISSHAGATDVAMTRTFHSEGWNTACFPFDITLDALKETFGSETTAAIYTAYDEAQGMGFSTIVSGTISAGKPFLIKPGIYVENPVFSGIALTDATAESITYGAMSFCGTIAPHTMNTNGTEFYLNSNNALTLPATDKNTMRGLRAYFRTEENKAKNITVLFDGEPSSIRPLQTDKHNAASDVFTISGVKLPSNKNLSRKGIVIASGKKFVNQ